MMKCLCCVFVLLFIIVIVEGKKLKIYKISLETKPKDRWNEIIKEYKEEIINVIEKTSELVLPILYPSTFIFKNYTINNRIHFKLIELFILPKLPHQYREEITGISKILQRPIGEVLVYNIFYDLISSKEIDQMLPFKSSSVIIQDKENNLIYQISKFDYLFNESIKNITFIVNFYQNNNLLYTSYHYGGYIGVLSGVKYNKFSITLNTREKGHLKDNLKYILYRQFNSVSLTIRTALEYENNFEDAILVLSETPYSVPVSFSITGNKEIEGCVVTSDRYKTLDVKYLNDTFLLSQKEDDSYLIDGIVNEINNQLNTTGKVVIDKILGGSYNNTR
uniref:NAAA-beta domain-containing protein n=1 Tax=Parastrongyloides trichosuri TaxID=131310 RepID=A0A0N4Z2E6_PARTI